MIKTIARIHRFLFARTHFFRINRFLNYLSLRGLGVLNYENDCVSGEAGFLQWYLSNKPRALILDVGAHVGNYALRVLKIQPCARVFSFEPHPVTFKGLEDASLRFGFKAFNVGCGTENGEMILYDYSNQKGSEHASMYKSVFGDLYGKESTEYRVSIVRLDDFSIIQGWENIDLLKLDVEGHEFNVLKGFEKFIKEGRIRAIQFEFNEMNILSRIFFKDFYDLLSEYSIFRLLPDGLVQITKYDPVLCESFAFSNYVAIYKDETSGGLTPPGGQSRRYRIK